MSKVHRNVILGLAVAGLLALAVDPYSATAQQKDKSKPSATAQQKDKSKPTATAAGAATFEMYKDTAGEFRFRLRDSEGALLATSGKGYKSKADCQKVIDAIKRDAAKAKVDDQSK
jgi:hypothetical protein